MNRENTCCFSGYRPEKLPWGTNEDDALCLALKEKLTDTLRRVYFSDIRHFICGMARGCDTYFCEAAIRLREDYPCVTIEAAIPCEGQSDGWRDEDRERYDRLVVQCDYRTYVSLEYTKDCMKRRNRYMVKNSSVLIAVFDGKIGGTMYTRNYAARRGIQIIEITP